MTIDLEWLLQTPRTPWVARQVPSERRTRADDWNRRAGLSWLAAEALGNPHSIPLEGGLTECREGGFGSA